MKQPQSCPAVRFLSQQYLTSRATQRTSIIHYACSHFHTSQLRRIYLALYYPFANVYSNNFVCVGTPAAARRRAISPQVSGPRIRKKRCRFIFIASPAAFLQHFDLYFSHFRPGDLVLRRALPPAAADDDDGGSAAKASAAVFSDALACLIITAFLPVTMEGDFFDCN